MLEPMPQTKPFDYAKVPLGGRDIRVLRLLPCSLDGADDIRGEIFVTSLDSPCQFAALSYSWGQGQARSNLQISDGTSLPITLALETALRGLREPAPLDLWIDQICINQDDSDEKDRQIPLMKDIYTRSSCTIAWLGLAVSSTEKAVRYLTRTGEAFSSLGLGPISKQLQEQLLADEETEATGLVVVPEALRPIKERVLAMVREEGEWDKLGALADLDEFFDAPYFRRGWIKQEVALPPKLIFRRGDYRIDGDILYAALQFHTRHWQYESMKLRAVTGKPLTPEIREKMEILLAERPGRDAANASLVARAKLHGTADEPPATLGTLIRRFRLNPTYTVGVARDDATMFSMPKDYVYGLLGLASDAAELRVPIHTSENVSMEAVYVDATRRIIDAGDVDFLFLAHRTASHQSLPSWVADFRSVSSVPHLTFRTISSAKPFSASLHRSQPARLVKAGSEDPMVLSLEGILVDTVEKVGEIWPAEEHGDRSLRQALPALSSLQDLILEAIEIMKASPSHPLYGSQEQKDRWEEAGWRIPVADHEYIGSTRWHSQRATPERSKPGAEELVQVVLRYYRLCVLGEPADAVLPLTEEETAGLLELAEPAQQESRKLEMQRAKLRPGGVLCNNYASSLAVSEVRRGFLGADGFVGIGPLEMRRGDVICVLFGATLPVVLRPVDGREGVYSYVGDVYCHGIMDGEALSWERGPRWFKLI